MKQVILREDSRNKPFHVFGQVVDFVEKSNFGQGVPLIVELPGEVDCTAISAIKVAYSQKKTLYDIPTLWNATPKTSQGADPKDTLGTAIKNGLLNVITKLFEKIWAGYFVAHTGSLKDSYDNVRSAMTVAQSSCTVASNWYDNWEKTPAGGIMPVGDRVVSSHDYVILDWDGDNFIIDSHQGYTTLMPRATFNAEMTSWGVGAYIPSSQEVDLIRKRNILELLVDAYKNLILLLKQLYLYGKLF